jgi:hypothetical protein
MCIFFKTARVEGNEKLRAAKTFDVPEGNRRHQYKSRRHQYKSRDDLRVGNTIDSGISLSITIDQLRVFINKTLILSAYQ